MQKFLQKFIMVCVVIIGVAGLIQGVQYFLHRGPTLSGNYLEDVGAIAGQTGVIMNNIAPYFQADTKASKEEILNKVTEAKKGLIDLNEKAKKLDSPAKMEGLHQQFLSSLKNYVAAFQLTEEGFQNNDNGKIGQAGELLIQGAGQMQDVSKQTMELAREQK